MDYSEQTDQQLTEMLRDGDSSAYNEIYHRYKRVLYLFGFKRSGDKEEVRDMLQDVFLSLWTRRFTIIISGSLDSYLHTAVKNKILDKIANKRLLDKYENSFRLYTFLTAGTIDHLVRHKVLQEIINKEVATLPKKCNWYSN